MASRAGPRATGTDGSNFQHRPFFLLLQCHPSTNALITVTVSQLSLVSHKVVHHPDSLLLLGAAPQQHQLPGYLHDQLKARLHPCYGGKTLPTGEACIIVK
uniref:Uncharacterized protein n=1 Tax=Sparus aurata TaxID=8175 RepID=A0A671UJ37_SPAAU